MLDNNPVQVAMETEDHEGGSSGLSTPPPEPDFASDPLVSPLPMLSPLNSRDGATDSPSAMLRSRSSVTSLSKRSSLRSSGSVTPLSRKDTVTAVEKQASVVSNHSPASKSASVRSQKSVAEEQPQRRSSLRSNVSVTSLRPQNSSAAESGLAKKSSMRSQASKNGLPQENDKVIAMENGEAEPSTEVAKDASEEHMETEDPAPESPATEGPSSSDAPPAYMGPPPIEIAISFDTTGSMSQCIEQVQAQVGHMIERLFMDIPNLKIAVIAHGDYCDAEHFYVTQKVDFTNDLPTLSKFVKEVTGTGGGDWEECYELVLQMARTELNWSAGTQRSLVMIGDAGPHPYGPLSRNIDWKREADSLYKDMGVSVYGVQCLSEDKATPFWAELAKRTHGKHLKLDQFGTIVDMIMAIVYREHDPTFFEAYEREVRNREGKGIGSDLDHMFSTLRNGHAATSSGITLPSTRFVKGAAKRTAPKKAANPRPRVVKPKKTAAPVAGPSGGSVVKQARKNAKALTVAERKEAKRAGKANVAAKKRTAKKEKAVRPKMQNRETVPAHKFVLKDLTWSPWKLGMAAKPPKENKDAWGPQRTGRFGFRNTELFENNKSKPAVYEFAIQTAPGRKMQTVYFHTTRCIPASMKWDRRLLNRDAIRHQLDRVLKQGQCSLYVRRAFISKPVTLAGKKCETVAKVSQALKGSYDYAWRSSRGRTGKYRTVKKNGCTISDATVEELGKNNCFFQY